MEKMNLQYSVAALYDGGWRTCDKTDLIIEYGLTTEEADQICQALAELEQ